MSTEGDGSIDWIVDLALPGAFFVVSTLFALYLAKVNRRDQRIQLTATRDLQYADEFLNESSELRAWAFRNEDPDTTAWIVKRLHDGMLRFCQFASGADPAALVYLSAQWNVLAEAQRTVEQFWYDVRMGEKSPPTRDSPIFSGDQLYEIDVAIDRMRSMVRDWPYPEKRRDCLAIIFAWNVASVHDQPTDPELAIDRMLLHALPSPNRAVRWAKRTSVTIRQLRDDVRFGRTAERLKRVGWDVEFFFAMRKEKSVYRSAHKQRRREKIALRKLYEAAKRHYDRSGDVPPWGYVIPVSMWD